MLKIGTSLDAGQIREMESIPAAAWFTEVAWDNATSPKHPQRFLAANNQMKQELVADWIRQHCKGKRVLDLFSANGAFAVLAAEAGATEVVGIEYDAERVRCARFVVSTTPFAERVRFVAGDVYRMEELADGPFDVVMCLGGLYHISDPALLLRTMHRMTTGVLILQTSHVLRSMRNVARFDVRREAREGLSSFVPGSGVWRFSVPCLRELVAHGGYRRIIDERRPPLTSRRRYPWYCAVCEA